MANFDKFAPRLLRWEGGYVNDPRDPGGATCKGVTLATYRLHFGANKTKEDLRGISQSEWRTIMKGTYWDACKADLIANQSVAEIFVDWCINSGLGMIKKVQAIIGTSADGIVGPKTIAAINKAGPAELHDDIKAAREAYYYAIVKKSPVKKAFLNGWLNRLADYNFSA